jgi:hypothetical protein
MGEDKIASFGPLVAGEARFHERLIARFPVACVEVTESPAARCRVLC